MSNNELQHVGVKGMKWGVRKSDRRGTMSSGRSRKTAPSGDSKNTTPRRTLKIAAIAGTAAAAAGAAYVAKARWDAGADARLFAQLQPDIIRRVANITEFRG